jgi:signal transduction histidine kinase
MKNKELGEEMKAYDQVLERSLIRVEGMRNLILDLLDFTKIRLDRKEEKMEKIDLSERAEMALATINLLAIQHNIEVSFQGDKTFYRADPSDMDILFNNLLSNAVKYNRDGGSVILSVRRESKLVEIEVKDTGIGMSAEEVSQLFKEFVRIKNNRTRGIAGSGLGLSIVAKIASLYGGRVHVESTPEEGSTFKVLLPEGDG